ncbi:hypothetical protein WEB32_29720 [Streptomyces netropsis]|uniref:hypothetical protein n=1 Tax=Streptomyces netropsis TaxID=55404 RepID=UPI0030D10E13
MSTVRRPAAAIAATALLALGSITLATPAQAAEPGAAVPGTVANLVKALLSPQGVLGGVLRILGIE